MLRSLLSGALRSRTAAGRSTGYGSSGYGNRRGGGDVGGAVGAQVGRSLLGRLTRRR